MGFEWCTPDLKAGVDPGVVFSAATAWLVHTLDKQSSVVGLALPLVQASWSQLQAVVALAFAPQVRLWLA